MFEGPPQDPESNEEVPTREQVVEALREGLGDYSLSLLNRHLDQKQKEVPESSPGALEYNILTAELYRDAGMFEAARSAFEDAAVQAWQERDDELHGRLLKETEEMQSLLSSEEAQESEKMEKIDYHEMNEIMRENGFTLITEHPDIMDHPSREEMRDQDFMWGVDQDDEGNQVVTVWRDGNCWARKGRVNIEDIEEAIGHPLVRGALQPKNLKFGHTDIGGERAEE